MLWTKHLIPGSCNFLLDEDYEDSPAHVELTKRLRKTLYYGKTPCTDRHSLPVTELAVEFFQDAAPRQLGKLDTYVASGFSRRACMSPSSLMLSMIYIERLKHRNPEYLQKISSADLFLISMMVASKYLYDEGIDEEVFNDEWAESAKLEVDDLNDLERNFLQAMDWHLFVSAENFWNVLTSVERELALRKGWEHGFYTYTDSWVLTDGQMAKSLAALMREITKVLLVCSLAYVGCLVTMVGATVTLGCIRHHGPTALAFLSPDVSSVALDVSGHGHLHPVNGASELPVFRPPPQDVSGGQLAGMVDIGRREVRKNSNLEWPSGGVPKHEDSQNVDNLEGHHSLLDDPHQPIGSCGGHVQDGPCRRIRKQKLHSKRSTYHAKKASHMKLALATSHGNLKEPQGFRFPGLLTLALIKDTFLQFVAALQEKLPATHNDRVPLVCTCGTCPGTIGIGCRNMTVNIPDPADGSCDVDHMGLDLTADPDIPLCHTDVVKRCCCPREDALSPWQLMSVVKPPVYDVVYGFATAAFVT